MKVSTTNTLNTILLLLLFAAFSCRKNIPGSAGITDVPAKKPPIAFAGPDIMIQLPLNTVFLSGNYSTENNYDHLEWKKIKGPACVIENQNNPATKVNSLQDGTYEFELTVFDKLNLSAKDTVLVTVLPAVSGVTGNSLFFINLTWIFPWYNALEIPNINSRIPQPFRVYVQRGFNSNWVEAYPFSTTGNNLYEYFIETRFNGAGMYNQGSLYIFYYGNITDDKPNVKIEF